MWIAFFLSCFLQVCYGINYEKWTQTDKYKSIFAVVFIDISILFY